MGVIKPLQTLQLQYRAEQSHNMAMKYFIILASTIAAATADARIVFQHNFVPRNHVDVELETITPTTTPLPTNTTTTTTNTIIPKTPGGSTGSTVMAPRTPSQSTGNVAAPRTPSQFG